MGAIPARPVTTLCDAAEMTRPARVVDWLIAMGASIDARFLMKDEDARIFFIDCSLGTPLYNAVVRDRPDVVALLLERDADASIGNEDGETPFDLAVKNGLDDIAEMLERATET